ncbi:glycosyltransferase [Rhodohalobacter sp. SW132]|uniref:glycosyltransferase family 2 protein n=1 Tax=Rhodohalobacter sp. SW132 TaxID=2293433 RepID=UPI000E22892F|nr:glycosyltransferase [Rhodohalobacter sp. SW132]REL25070.1 glycosyltransferase [Rhodohalobacter sp. SW132]
MKRVTAVIVNYQTPELLYEAVLSFKKIYPDVRLVIFDNGSEDHSITVIKSLQQSYPDTVSAHFERKNIFHGPALDKSLQEIVETEFCFFLDSDTVTKKGGFLEKGVEQLNAEPLNYAAGHIVTANARGFKSEDGVPVVVTPYLLMKTNPYKQFPPFIHHGQPTLENFTEAQKNGYRLIHFPMEKYIDHLWRGTASKYGYGLGLKGKLDYVLNKLGL